MVTPFSETGELDLEMLCKQVDWQIAGGTDALVVCATTGECATLQDREWETVVACTVEHTAGRIPVIAGIGRNDTRHAVWLNKRARTLGVQGVLAVTPYYNKTTQKGLIRHYETIADSADVPVILYNVPSRTGMSFTAETYQALSKHPNIYGVKEASGDFSLMLKTKHLCPDDFTLYSGNDDQIVPVMALGGQGVITTMGNVVPAHTHELCCRWLNGDREGALAIQTKLQPLIEALFREVNPIPVKAALKLMNRDSGYLRQPLVEISETAFESLQQALKTLALI